MDQYRVEFTNISVQKNGKWFTNGREIINTRVLSFFKKSLYRDQTGIYIENEFGLLKEKGYIKVHGPILSVHSIEGRFFLLENGEHIKIQCSHLVLDNNLSPYLKVSRLNAWSFFDHTSAGQLANLIRETDNTFFFGEQALQIHDQIKWA